MVAQFLLVGTTAANDVRASCLLLGEYARNIRRGTEHTSAEEVGNYAD